MNKKSPSVFVFLGAGGVGKTTLSAAFAASLALSGKKVALLSIDPARRLQSALGVKELRDELVSIPLPPRFRGKMWASQLGVEEAFGRWVREQGMPLETERRLHGHVFFKILVERIATLGDGVAAVRIAEIMEKEPALDAIVVDTAPGLHAIDFLVKPERVREFLKSRAFELIKRVGSGGGLFSKALRLGAGRILDALGNLGGTGFLAAFSELLVLSEDVFETMARRLESASQMMRSRDTAYVLVSAVRDDSLKVACELSDALRGQRVGVSLSVLNRALSEELNTDAQFRDFLKSSSPGCEEERLFANYLNAWLTKQKCAIETLSLQKVPVVSVPFSRELGADTSVRLLELASLVAPIFAHFFPRYRGLS